MSGLNEFIYCQPCLVCFILKINQKKGFGIGKEVYHGPRPPLVFSTLLLLTWP